MDYEKYYALTAEHFNITVEEAKTRLCNGDTDILNYFVDISNKDFFARVTKIERHR